MRPPASIDQLHQQIDAQTARLNSVHADRLVCGKGCAACCVDNLTVFQVEADRIRTQAAAVLSQKPAPPGRCAFLDADNACRIYDVRPYVCRTQGLPLAWVEEEDGEWVQYRDICELNEAGPPLETLDEADCWMIGEAEGALSNLQARHPAGPGSRVGLRSLFSST